MTHTKHQPALASPARSGDALAFDPNRRALLRALGAGAALTPWAARGASTAPGPATAGLARLGDDAAFWSELRQLFGQQPGLRFMNVGTVGSMPVRSLTLLDKESRRAAREALDGYGNYLTERQALGRSFGADVDEMVMSGNTSDGMCQVLQGLVWQRGDEIVTTNHEHRGGNVPMALVQDRFGVVVKRVSLPVGNKQRAEDYVALFAAAIGPRTRAIVFSSPTFTTGTLLPIEMLARLAQARGVLSICDGAHLPGMMNYRYRELGVDFIAAAGHKWQCGPLGTGILYIRNKVLPRYNPRPLPPFYPLTTSDYPLAGGLPPRTTNATASDDIAARVQDLGSANAPVYAALVESCAIWDRIGRDKIETYTVAMASYLKRRIAQHWGEDALYAPMDDPQLNCAMASFNPFRNPADVKVQAKSDAFIERMRSDYGYVLRNVRFQVPGSPEDHFGVRISTHLWSNFADVDGVVEAMKELSGKMA